MFLCEAPHGNAWISILFSKTAPTIPVPDGKIEVSAPNPQVPRTIRVKHLKSGVTVDDGVCDETAGAHKISFTMVREGATFVYAGDIFSFEESLDKIAIIVGTYKKTARKHPRVTDDDEGTWVGQKPIT
jgi:hypothetical protein